MTGAAFVGARSVAPPPGGAGGRTTPPFGHPSLKEGNVRGSLASAGRRCILLRQPSPVRWPSPGRAGERSPRHPPPAPPATRSARKPPCPQAVPTKDPNHHALPESNAQSLPQTVSAQEPEHHGGPERNAPSPPQTASVPRHSPPLRRGGRMPGWSARDGRQAVADTSRTSSSVLPKRVVVDKACRWRAGWRWCSPFPAKNSSEN